MLFQIFTAGRIHAVRRHKRVWVLGSTLQGPTVLAMALSALALNGLSAALAILALLSLFALARSLSSVASKDVLGKVLPRHRRGRAGGWATGAAGVISLAASGLALWPTPDELSVRVLAILLACAGVSWLLAVASFTAIVEPDGEHDSDSAGLGWPVDLPCLTPTGCCGDS